jgi:hypothetical protein
VTVQLVVGYGVRATGSPDLTFGMSRDEVLEAWSGKHLYRPFVCGMGWALGINLTGVDIGVFGDDDGKLGLMQISRLGTFYRDGREGLAEHEPVVFEDIDVFYWPPSDIVEFLGASGLAVTSGDTHARVGREVIMHAYGDSARFNHIDFWGPRLADEG